MAKASALVMAEIEQDLLAAMNSLDKASAAMVSLSNTTDEKYATQTYKTKDQIKRILNARYDWLARKKMKK